MPMQNYKITEASNEEYIKMVAGVTTFNKVSHKMHKNLSHNLFKRRTRAQQSHNVTTNFLPVNVKMGYYVTIRVHARE